MPYIFKYMLPYSQPKSLPYSFRIYFGVPLGSPSDKPKCPWGMSLGVPGPLQNASRGYCVNQNAHSGELLEVLPSDPPTIPVGG